MFSNTRSSLVPTGDEVEELIVQGTTATTLPPALTQRATPLSTSTNSQAQEVLASSKDTQLLEDSVLSRLLAPFPSSSRPNAHVVLFHSQLEGIQNVQVIQASTSGSLSIEDRSSYQCSRTQPNRMDEEYEDDEDDEEDSSDDSEDSDDEDEETSPSDRKRRRKSNEEQDFQRDNISEQFWLQRFNELKEFREQHEHCNPSYRQHAQLYSWLHRQKFFFRKGRLSKERYDLLASIGVHFDYHWDEMYAQLRSCRQNAQELDPKLSSWLWGQIYAWRSAKLSYERATKLDELGYSPDMQSDNTLAPPKPPTKKKRKSEVGQSPSPAPERRIRDPPSEKKSEKNWLDMFIRLKHYKALHNTLSVSSKSDKKLNLWVRTQRKNWRQGKLQPWKQQKLQRLGLTPNYERKTQSNDSFEAASEEEVLQQESLVTLQQLQSQVVLHYHTVDSDIQAVRSLGEHHDIDRDDVNHIIQHIANEEDDKLGSPVHSTLLSLSQTPSRPEDIGSLDIYTPFLPTSQSDHSSHNYPT